MTKYFKNVAANVKPASNSHQYNVFVGSVLHNAREYHRYDYTPPKTTEDEYIVRDLLGPVPAELDPRLLDKDVILAYRLNSLSMFLYSQTYYSPVLLSAIKQLKSQYPNSELLTAFDPKIEKLKEYLKVAAIQYDKGKIIETSYLKFEDLIETFKGRNILIDVWATWCGPCVEEFAYKSNLKKYIGANKISVLYISIDQPRWEKKWRENIKYNQLEGEHVLASEQLILSMWEWLGGKAGQIPRYALINKEGKLVVPDAARPSDWANLNAQIEKMLAGSW